MKKNIESLTALRFFAAFAIVLHHARGVVFEPDFLYGVPLAAGVSFFFVLSGFILAYVYAESIQSVGLYSFIAARFSRIWPAHIATFLLVLLFYPSVAWTHGAEYPWLIAFFNVALLQSLVPIPAYYFSFNSVSWSISTEAIFYLCFPFLVASYRRTWQIKLVFLLALGFAAVWFLDYLKVNYYSAEKLGMFSAHGVAYISPLARIQEFYIGILSYMVFKFLSKYTALGYVGSTVIEVVMIGSLWFLPAMVDFFYSIAGQGNPALSEYFGHLIAGVIFGCIVICFALSRGAISRFLSQRVFVFFGEISFSVYLLHQIIFVVYSSKKGIFESVPQIIVFSSLFLFTCIAAYILWQWIEKPANIALKSFFESLKPSRLRPLKT